MRTRRLTLQRETLTALASDELTLVAGGAAAHTIPDPQCVLTPFAISKSVLPCHTSPCTN